MPVGIVTNGVILRVLGGTMRKFKRFPPRTLRFRLLLILAGALLLMAALVPRANAQTVATLVYFNFEDAVVAEARILTPMLFLQLGDNPGGGIRGIQRSCPVAPMASPSQTPPG